METICIKSRSTNSLFNDTYSFRPDGRITKSSLCDSFDQAEHVTEVGKWVWNPRESKIDVAWVQSNPPRRYPYLREEEIQEVNEFFQQSLAKMVVT